MPGEETELRVTLLKNAKKFIQDMGLVQFVPRTELSLWMKAKIVKCYTLVRSEDDAVLSFLIVHKPQSDPFRQVTNGYVIDHVHTIAAHRRQGYASKLLELVRNHTSTYALMQYEHPPYMGTIFRRAGHTEGVTPDKRCVFFSEKKDAEDK